MSRSSALAPSKLGSAVLTFLAAVALLLTGSAVAQGGAPEETLEYKANFSFWWGDFEALERLYEVARNATDAPPDAFTQLAPFRRGLALVFNDSDNPSDAYRAQVEALTHRWATDHPQSALAQMMYARALYARAWGFRGTGYAATVQPQAWADFRRCIGKAIDHVAANAALLKSHSTANAYLLMLGRSADWSREQKWAVARDGLDKNPRDFGIYEELLISSLPKWGGSGRYIDEVVSDAVKRSHATEGLAWYALLYEQAADDLDGALFNVTAADWSMMRQGFRDLLARHPHPDHVNRFARMACLAQDKASTLEMLEKIGNKPIVRMWGGGTNATRKFEACKRWASSS